jgi:hypothetical protein
MGFGDRFQPKYHRLKPQALEQAELNVEVARFFIFLDGLSIPRTNCFGNILECSLEKLSCYR